MTRRDQAKIEMAAAVAGLLALDNSVADAAALTEQPETQIRRLSKLAARAARTAADNGADTNGYRPAEEPARRRDGEGQSTRAFGSGTVGIAMADADEASPEHASTAGAERISAEPDVAL